MRKKKKKKEEEGGESRNRKSEEDLVGKQKSMERGSNSRGGGEEEWKSQAEERSSGGMERTMKGRRGRGMGAVCTHCTSAEGRGFPGGKASCLAPVPAPLSRSARTLPPSTVC